MKKSNFRIISVTDTVNHEVDDESGTLDDEKIDTNNVPGDSDENLEGNQRNNLNSKSAKKNSAKSNQSLGNSWNVPGDRSERGDEFDTEIDTAKRDKEEPKSPNKLKSSFKALNDSITALEVEPKDNKVFKISGRKMARKLSVITPNIMSPKSPKY